MNMIDVLILGIVEGITEFIPVSSTGHLLLASKIMGLPSTSFLKTFTIAIQLGAISSVVVLYWRKFLVDFEVLKRVLAAFIPTAVAGLIFYKFIKHCLMESPWAVVYSLFFGGIIIILFEIFHKEKKAEEGLEKISYRTAVLIGIFQSIAMIPGVSRSAATIIGGMGLGVKRRTIVEFSFLLAVPTMLAATTWDLYKNAGEFSVEQFSFLGAGFAVSFIVAILSIKFLLRFIKNHNFVGFGIYRILASIVYGIFFI